MEKRTLWMVAAVVITLIIAVVLFRFATSYTLKRNVTSEPKINQPNQYEGSVLNWAEPNRDN
jgi:heme/copper-type cytochrome/quinol oxidase subunit 2